MSAYDGIHTLAESFRKLFEQDATNCTETLLGVKDQNPVGFFDSAAESIGTQVQLQAEADTEKKYIVRYAEITYNTVIVSATSHIQARIKANRVENWIDILGDDPTSIEIRSIQEIAS